MFFVELDDDGISIADIKRIAKHIATDYKRVIKQLTTHDAELLSFILKPTLEKDHAEDEIRKHWNQFIREFSLTNEEGNKMRFFYGEDRHLYFGDKEGIETAKNLSHNADYPQNPYHSDD